MSNDKTPWPSIAAYALAHPCPTCKAPPRQVCNAPRKAGAADPANRLHAPRIDRGIAHYDRDRAAAPWEEDREPGKSYDTIAAVLRLYDEQQAGGRAVRSTRATVGGSATQKATERQERERAQKRAEADQQWPGPACDCPRQGDLWRCRDRPALLKTPEGEHCALGRQLFETGSDWWPPGSPG